jgi:hypothetical protein
VHSSGPSGIDLSSEELLSLANHPMCFGVKARVYHRSLRVAQGSLAETEPLD